MIYQIKCVGGKWDMKKSPVIGDVIVLNIDNKYHALKVCRHMVPGTVCDQCAFPRVVARSCACCETISDSHVCGVGSQNLQPYDLLEEL